MFAALREAGVTIRRTLPCRCPLTHAANWPTSTKLPLALLSTAPGLQEQRSCSEIQGRPDSSLERMLVLSLNTLPNRMSILNLSCKQDTRDENLFMFCIKPPPKTSIDRAGCEDHADVHERGLQMTLLMSVDRASKGVCISVHVHDPRCQWKPH